MLFRFFLLLIALVQVSSSQDSNACVQGDKLPNEKDCIFYFICIRDEYVQVRCKKIDLIIQTYFDIITKECLVRENATCFGQSALLCTSLSLINK